MFATLRQIPLAVMGSMALVLGPVLPHAAAAQSDLSINSLHVTTTVDEYKRNRKCSLREAVYAAVHDVKVDSCGRGSEVDEIILPSGTYRLSRINTSINNALSGDLDLSGSINIIGASSANTIIDGNNTDRIFEIIDGSISLNNLTLQNGRAPYIGGAVYMQNGTLTINHSVIQYNQAQMGDPTTTDDDQPTYGGAIALDNGTLDISNTTIRENDTQSEYRWHRGFGGAIYAKSGTNVTINASTIDSNSGQWYEVSDIVNDGTLSINNTTLQNMAIRGIKNNTSGILSISSSSLVNNVAPVFENHGTASVEASEFSGSTLTNTFIEYCENGGAIQNKGVLSVNHSYLHDNIARNGGGIWNSGTLSVLNTSIISNTGQAGGHFCAGQGGAIFMAAGSLNLENSTLSFNVARGSGGAIWFEPSAQGTLLNNTIASNINTLEAVFGAAIPDAAGIATNANTVTLTNTIVADNHSPLAPSDCWGPLNSGGYNLVQAPTATCTFSGVVDGQQIGVNPLLGALGDYGGPTPTQPLLLGSPAIDAASPTVCPATDQRGVSRPQDGDDQGFIRCDIGAFEVE